MSPDVFVNVKGVVSNHGQPFSGKVHLNVFESGVDFRAPLRTLVYESERDGRGVSVDLARDESVSFDFAIPVTNDSLSLGLAAIAFVSAPDDVIDTTGPLVGVAEWSRRAVFFHRPDGTNSSNSESERLDLELSGTIPVRVHLERKDQDGQRALELVAEVQQVGWGFTGVVMSSSGGFAFTDNLESMAFKYEGVESVWLEMPDVAEQVPKWLQYSHEAISILSGTKIIDGAKKLVELLAWFDSFDHDPTESETGGIEVLEVPLENVPTHWANLLPTKEPTGLRLGFKDLAGDEDELTFVLQVDALGLPFLSSGSRYLVTINGRLEIVEVKGLRQVLFLPIWQDFNPRVSESRRSPIVLKHSKNVSIRVFGSDGSSLTPSSPLTVERIPLVDVETEDDGKEIHIVYPEGGSRIRIVATPRTELATSDAVSIAVSHSGGEDVIMLEPALERDFEAVFQVPADADRNGAADGKVPLLRIQRLGENGLRLYVDDPERSTLPDLKVQRSRDLEVWSSVGTFNVDGELKVETTDSRLEFYRLSSGD